MRMHEQIGGVMLAVVVSLVATEAVAQMPLRWKFKLGETLDYRMVEEMTLTTRGAPLDETNTPLHQEMGMTWKVVGVKDDGEAVIEQRFHDVTLKMTGPRGEKIEYKSGGDEATASLAAMVAPIYDALTKGDFEFTMTADRKRVV